MGTISSASCCVSSSEMTKTLQKTETKGEEESTVITQEADIKPQDSKTEISTQTEIAAETDAKQEPVPPAAYAAIPPPAHELAAPEPAAAGPAHSEQVAEKSAPTQPDAADGVAREVSGVDAAAAPAKAKKKKEAKPAVEEKKAPETKAPAPEPVNLVVERDPAAPQWQARSKKEQSTLGRQMREAAKSGNLTEVKNHLAMGVDPNAADADGWTSVILACEGGHADILKVLIANKADATASVKLGEWGNTGLHRAAMGGHVAVVDSLLKAKCDLRMKNYNGKTAGDIAKAENKDEFYKVLKAALVAANAK